MILESIEFESFKNAWNKLCCELGDCVVDDKYDDGENHRFIKVDNNNYALFTGRTPMGNRMMGSGNIMSYYASEGEQKFASAFLDMIYPGLPHVHENTMPVNYDDPYEPTEADAN